MAHELLEGFRATWGNRYLLAFAGEAATYNVFWSAMEAVLLLWAVKELGLTAGMLGLLLAVGSCGAVLGAALTKLAARNFGAGITMIGSAIVSNVGTLLIPLAPALVAALGMALFLRGVGMTGCNVQVYAVRQAITPDHLMGRVNAVYTVISRGFVPVGALLGGASERISGCARRSWLGRRGCSSLGRGCSSHRPATCETRPASHPPGLRRVIRTRMPSTGEAADPLPGVAPI